MGGGILFVAVCVAVCRAVAVAGAEGLELLERLGGGAGATLRAAAVRIVMGAVIQAVTVADEGGGDFGGGGEIIGLGPATGSDGAPLAEALPAAQLREADEADAVALAEAGGGDGQAHGLAAAALLVLREAVIGHQGQPAIDLGGELDHGGVAGDQLMAEQGAEHVGRQSIVLGRLHGRAQAEPVAERRQFGNRALGEFHRIHGGNPP
jgi:hypothetical protein